MEVQTLIRTGLSESCSREMLGRVEVRNITGMTIATGVRESANK